MINNIQQIYHQSNQITRNDNLIAKRNEYIQRSRFFRTLFDTNNLQQTFLGQQSFNIGFGNARHFAQLADIPSLVQFKYYFMPALFYDQLRYQQSHINNINDLPQNSKTDLFYDVPNAASTLNPNTLLGLPQNSVNNPFPSFIRLNLNNLISEIQLQFEESTVEKIFFNLEVLYSNIEEDDADSIIIYERAWANIDKQIIELCEDNNNPLNRTSTQIHNFVEDQQFIYDIDSPKVFTLRIDDVNQHTGRPNLIGGNPNHFVTSWRKRNFNYQFVKDSNDPQNFNEEFTFFIPDNNNNNQQIRSDILNHIYEQIQVLDEYEEAYNPTFLRYVDLYIIKEFTIAQVTYPQQNLILIDQQPYVLQNNIDSLLQAFLDGLLAFDSKSKNKNNILDANDIVKIDKDQHCLFRVLYYFENQKSQISYKNFMLDQIQKAKNPNNLILSNNEKIFFGSVHSLVKEIKEKYNIILGVHCIKSSRSLFSQNPYQLLIKDNHVVLTTKNQNDNIKIKNQYNYPYIMRNKEYKKPKRGQKKEELNEEEIEVEQQEKEIPQSYNFYLDMETFVLNQEGQQDVYLICLIDDDLNKIQFKGQQCVLDFLDYIEQNILINYQQKIINIWSFNGGKFDYMFLMTFLIHKFPNIKIIGTDTDVKQINIDNVYFKDIKYIFAQGSLKQQAKMWGVQQQKQDFDIKNWKLEDYQNEQKFIKVLEYCFQDCLVLKGLVDKFFELVNYEFENNINNTKKVKLDIRNIFSSSSLTLTIFRSFYLKFDLKSNIKRNIYQIERDSYYGGITMNFKKQGQNLFYYDINSSYPNVMKNNMVPIAPLNNSQQQIIQCQKDFNVNMCIPYYLYEVEVEFCDQIIIPCLPKRTKDGLLYLKKVEKSWRWGTELIFINKWKQQKNIKFFNVLKYQGEVIFKEFIEDLYNKRLETQRSDLKQFYKNLMNGGYGKYGQKEFPEIEYCHSLQMEENIRNPLLSDITQINDQIFKLKYAKKDNLQFVGSLVRIASFITSQARVNLLEGVYITGHQNLYYCDTDSIITSKQLPQNMIGNQLGQWKLENEIAQGIFVAPKIYYIKLQQPDKDNKIDHMKCKGIRNDILTKQIFDQLIDKNYIKLTNIGVFTRKFGTIFIADQQKLVRILDLKRKWIDNQNSIPYYDLLEYQTDKLVKQDENLEKLKRKNLEKNYKNLNNDQINKKLEKTFTQYYNKVINNDSEINQKRRQLYIDQTLESYIQKKVYQ